MFFRKIVNDLKREKNMAKTGIEPATQGFSVLKSPIWQLL